MTVERKGANTKKRRAWKAATHQHPARTEMTELKDEGGRRLTAVDDVSSAGVLVPALPLLDVLDWRLMPALRRGPYASLVLIPLGVPLRG